MFRKLWGGFDENPDDSEDVDENADYEPCSSKKAKFDEIAASGIPKPVPPKTVEMKILNSLITQTVEVTDKTDMLKDLLETYSNKTDEAPVPPELLPKFEFPIELTSDLTGDSKPKNYSPFVIPEKTIVPKEPVDYPELTNNICRSALRKSISGLLINSGYACCNESALVVLTDSADDYIRRFLQEVRTVQDLNPSLEHSNQISIPAMETAYARMTGRSLLDLAKHYKEDIVEKNLDAVDEFEDTIDDYEELRKENEAKLVEEDAQHIASIINSEGAEGIELPSTSLQTHSSSFMNILDELLKTSKDLEPQLDTNEEPDSSTKD